LPLLIDAYKVSTFEKLVKKLISNCIYSTLCGPYGMNGYLKNVRQAKP